MCIGDVNNAGRDAFTVRREERESRATKEEDVERKKGKGTRGEGLAERARGERGSIHDYSCRRLWCFLGGNTWARKLRKCFCYLRPAVGIR